MAELLAARQAIRPGGDIVKALKSFAVPLGALAVLLAGVAFLIVTTFDANAWKPEIARIVKERTHRTLALEGDLSLSFWPRAGITLGRTTLSEYESGKPFAALDLARISLALLPLLGRRVVVDRVEVSGLSANLVRTSDGRLNIRDLTSKDDQGTRAWAFDIAAINLDGAALSYRDEGSGLALRLSDATLSTGRVGSAAEGDLRLVGRLGGESPKHDAVVDMSARYEYDGSKPSYAVTKFEATLNGELRGTKGVHIALAAANARLNGSTRVIEVDRLRVAAKRVEGPDSYEVGLALPSGTIAADRVSLGVVDANAKLSGPRHNFNAKLNCSGIDVTTGALTVAKVLLELDGSYADTSIAGTIATQLRGNLAPQFVELPQLEGRLILTHPMIREKRVDVRVNGEVHGDWGKQRMWGKLAAGFDDSTLDATWELATFGRPALRFDIDINRLDADRYTQRSHGNATDEVRGSEALVQEPSDRNALGGLNARGSIRIGTLQLRNAKARDVRLDIESDGDKPDQSRSP